MSALLHFFWPALEWMFIVSRWQGGALAGSSSGQPVLADKDLGIGREIRHLCNPCGGRAGGFWRRAVPSLVNQKGILVTQQEDTA